jgi:hypothetical protein
LFAAWENYCNTSQQNCIPAANFIIWSDFIDAVKKKSSIPITTIADIYSGNPLSVSCEIRLRAWEVEVLEKEQFISVTCFETNGNYRTSIRPPSASGPRPNKPK